MRGIGHTLSRLPKAPAFLAGAVIIAGSFGTTAHGQGSGSGNGTGAPTHESRAIEVASLIPRVGRGGAPRVLLAQPLSPGDVAITRRVFALQAQGNIPEAIRTSADLRDPLLLGALLADRYLGRRRQVTADELSDWLDNFRDQPDAPAIHALLLAKLPNSAPLPATPETVSLSRSVEPAPASRDTAATRSNLQPPAAFDRLVVDRARHGEAAQALRLIAVTRGISRGDAARLRAEVAQASFTRNEDTDALRIVEESIRGHAARRTEQSDLLYRRPCGLANGSHRAGSASVRERGSGTDLLSAAAMRRLHSGPLEPTRSCTMPFRQ